MNINCVPSEAFDIKSNSISLKEYPDDLLMYFSGEDTGLNLTKSSGLSSPYNPIAPDEYVYVKFDETAGPYTYVAERHSLTYYKNNFRNFQKGTIRLTVKKENCENDFGYQDFYGFQGVENVGTYSIYFSIRTNSIKQVYPITFVLEEAELNDLDAICEKINSAIINNPENDTLPFTLKAEVLTDKLENRFLRIRTAIDTGAAVVGYVEMSPTANTDTLEVWFSDIRKASYYSAPDVDTKVFSLHELTGVNNEISLIHTADEPTLLDGEAEPGYIYLYMADEDGKYSLTKKIAPWTWDNEDFVEIEINFDDSLSNVIINGKVAAFFETVGVDSHGNYDSIVRSTNPDTYLTFVNNGDAYGFKEFDAFNKKQHCGSYDAPESVKTYDGTAYVEYEFGELKLYDDKTIDIQGEGNFFFEAYDDGIPLADADGNPIASNDISTFKEMFENLDYDPSSTLSFETSDLTFRITFLDKDSVITGFNLNKGTEVYDENDPYNFEDLYGWVRRQLGAPQIACELTDDQIYDALCRAVEKYNKYRNWNENLNISDIGGLAETDLKKVHGEKWEGDYFLLPANINPKDIVDIFFQPRFSVCWFGAGDNFLNNVMSQTFFGLYGGIVQNSADYYIHRVTCNDISNIIGTQVSWRIYNHHLYLTPNNLHDLEQFTVGIKYRPALSVEEIRNSEDIKALTLAYAMRTLGLIRGSFGGSIQAGDIAIQLNAETLLAEADKLEEKTINLLKSEQKPLWIMWT